MSATLVLAAVAAGLTACVGDLPGGSLGKSTDGAGGTPSTSGAGGTAGRPPRPGTDAAPARDAPAAGCSISFPALGDPLIADFATDMGGSSALPIGGTYQYAAPPDSPTPVQTVFNGAWHVTLTAAGRAEPQYLGAGIYFNGDAAGTACVDASFHTGVQFDIGGTIAGTGCTAQYSTNDSAHTDSTLDPKASGLPGSYAPQAALTITSAPTTVLIPFTGFGSPSGGDPMIPIDPAKLIGVQWQFTVQPDAEASCLVDVTIDNVRFF